MVEKAAFSLKQRNPDVLTSIANLSNDEVFTPPSFANQMLDTIEEAWAKDNKGAIIWEDKEVTFLDPFTKSGVFLREITSRLTKGLEKEIPDAQERVNHILTKQVFGVAITELTSLLARRSLYCSKFANGKHSICTEFGTPEGNIWFQRTEHSWVGGKEKVITVDDHGKDIEVILDGTCKFCGAKQKEYERGLEAESHAYALIHTNDPKAWVKSTFGEDMQFDVIVGNPPYQLDDGGFGASASPIYQMFVEQAINLEPRLLAMVIPSRWFGGGKGLDQFRERMLGDRRISHLVDFPNAADAFPGVDISGGVCYFLWQRDRDGDCEVSSFRDGRIAAKDVRPLLEPGLQTFLRYSESVSIVRKIRLREHESSAKDPQSFEGAYASVHDIARPSKPFGLRTFVKGHTDHNYGDLVLYKFGETAFIERALLTAGHDIVEKYKVITSRVAFDHGGNPGKDGTRKVFSTIRVMPPGSVCTETYVVVGAFDLESQAENLALYMRTKFFRFLVSLLMVSHDIPRSRYRLVPLQDFSKPWTDEELYVKYKLTKEEIEFIESMIRPMELEDA